MKENVLTEFNTGGSHEENPLGGIQQGTGPNGQPNTVEEGETKFTVGNTPYIFSNKINNVDRFVDAFALPSYTKGLPFSDASKKITEAFKDRKDNASQSTLKAFLDRLVDAQELAKLENAAEEADMSVEEYLTYQAQQQAEAQVAQEQAQAEQQAPAEGGQAPVEGEQVPQEVPQEAGQGQFADGGAIMGSAAGQGAVASGVMGMGTSMMGDLAQAKDGEVRDTMSVGGTAAKYALMGAAAGSVVPGIGTAIGAGVGAVAGGTMAVLSNEKVAGEQQTADNKEAGEKLKAAGFRAEYGGALNIFKGGGDMFEIDYLQEQEDDMTAQNEQFNRDNGLYNERTAVIAPKSKGLYQPGIEPLDIKTPLKKHEPPETKGNNNLAGIGGLAASMAPFIGNMVESASLERDDPTHYNRVGKTFRPQYADEQSLVNQAMEGFSGSNGNIANATNGSIGAYRANMLGNSVNKSKARSTAYNQINETNRQEERLLNEDNAVAQREEVALANRELVEGKQDEAAYQSAKSAYRKAAYEGLGEMGRTIFQVSQQDDMTPYDQFGNRKKTENA